MPTETTPDAFIVRVFGPSGQPVGAGVLVGERRILTCAHVVNAALGLDQRAQERPNDFVTVDFPLLAIGERLTARVLAWVPPPREDIAGDDSPPQHGNAPGWPAASGHRFPLVAPGRNLGFYRRPGPRR